MRVFYHWPADYANLRLETAGDMLVKCPRCGKEIEYEGNEFRPFCSDRCKLIDFGAWADEKYGLAVEDAELTEEDIEAIEKAINERTRV